MMYSFVLWLFKIQVDWNWRTVGATFISVTIVLGRGIWICVELIGKYLINDYALFCCENDM